jgi:hypothetical protein
MQAAMGNANAPLKRTPIISKGMQTWHHVTMSR